MIPDFNLTINDGPEQVEFNVLGYVDTGSGWDWSVEALIERADDKALFLTSDGGCSCNYFGDYLTVADLTPVFSIAEAMRLSRDRSALERSIAARERVYE